MKNNYFKKIALATMLSLAGGFYENNSSKGYNPDVKASQKLERIIEKDQIFNQRIQEQSSDEIQAPQYRTPRDYCSRYARLAAKELFEKEYSWEDAWNLRYKDKIAHHFNEKESFKDLIIENTLRPGMLIGIKQPDNRTSHENTKDLEGNKAKYTHVILYAGVNNNGEPEFLHQYGWKKEKITEKDFEKLGFKPIEILTTKDDKIYLAENKQ